MRYFEDVEVGSTATFGSYDVTPEEIKEFAEKYDPQPFHTDEAVASESMFGGLVASGWHTMAMCMRMITEQPDPLAALAGVEVNHIKWRKPVRPGDTLSARTEIVDTEPWDDDHGKVDVRIETLVDDAVVCSMVGLVLFARHRS